MAEFATRWRLLSDVNDTELEPITAGSSHERAGAKLVPAGRSIPAVWFLWTEVPLYDSEMWFCKRGLRLEDEELN